MKLTKETLRKIKIRHIFGIQQTYINEISMTIH